ncbi:holin family protein [Amaricoccus tamworthensis]|uniref:holin family protein n=1 Tax=Amaricoccus tamworthensis TaxID=57002 RepID=UPI003C7D7E8B
MGLIGNILSLGRGTERLGKVVEGVAEVFVGNRAKREEAEFEKFEIALKQYSDEFKMPSEGPFDRFVNALNRMPRPLLALGTLGLFGYSMIDPPGFSSRMQGLNLIPEPLWWLLGVIVSFYFGAREMHHFRSQRQQNVVVTSPSTAVTTEVVRSEPNTQPPQTRSTHLGLFSNRNQNTIDPNHNAALEEWRRLNA